MSNDEYDRHLHATLSMLVLVKYDVAGLGNCQMLVIFCHVLDQTDMMRRIEEGTLLN